MCLSNCHKLYEIFAPGFKINNGYHKIEIIGRLDLFFNFSPARNFNDLAC